MLGFVAPTDHGWYQFLRARPDITEVNFWRPGGTTFKAIAPGAPFFFKLKRQHNAIGGFGLFTRAERLPVWRAWDVFGQANGTRDEHDLLVRLDRLGGRDAQSLGRNRMIGCIAITEPVFFTPDEWVAVPSDWARNIVSGRTEDLSRRGTADVVGLPGAGCRSKRHRGRMGSRRSRRPARRQARADHARPGQSSFRLAVLDAYGQQCAVTTEHSLPVIDAAHIRPWAVGGTHSIPNGVPLRRDLHRLFDLGYVTINPDLRFAVSRRLRDDYANARGYYELDGRQIRLPESDSSRPDSAALAWHEREVFLGR